MDNEMDWSQKTFKRCITCFNSLGVQGGALRYGWRYGNSRTLSQWGMIKKEKCTVLAGHLWNIQRKKKSESMSFAWITSYSFRRAWVRVEQNLLTFLQTTQYFDRLFQFLVITFSIKFRILNSLVPFGIC